MSYDMGLDQTQNSVLEVPRRSNRTEDNYNYHVHKQTNEIELASSGVTIPPISSRPDQNK
jgi:hypothetical protein